MQEAGRGTRKVLKPQAQLWFLCAGEAAVRETRIRLG